MSKQGADHKSPASPHSVAGASAVSAQAAAGAGAGRVDEKTTSTADLSFETCLAKAQELSAKGEEQWKKAENWYVTAFKRVSFGLHPANSKHQVDCLLGLAALYHEYTKDSKYLHRKLAVLYNAALVRLDPKQDANKIEEIRKLIAANEQEFLRKALGSGKSAADEKQPPAKASDQKAAAAVPKTMPPSQAARNYKLRLEQLREYCRTKLAKLGIGAEYDETRAKAIRKIYSNIATEYQQIVKELVEECEETLGPAPCEYAVIGLGSLAREEVTPYSDLEFAILIAPSGDPKKDDANKEYFRKLTELMHLKVIKLGETILPSMGMPKLNWYYDDITPRGFSFDADISVAGKTGLGNEAKGYELIHTPQGLTDLHNEEWQELDKFLSVELATSCLITGDRALHDNYVKMRTEWFTAKPSNELTRGQAQCMRKLAEDLASYLPQIDQADDEGRVYEVKKEVYRLLHLIIDNLARYYNLTETSSWARLEALYKRGMLTFNSGAKLYKALSITTELRLRTYLEHGRQAEALGMLPLLPERAGKSAVLADSYRQHLFEYYYTVLPLARSLQGVNATDLPRRLLAYSSDRSARNKAWVHKRLMDYDKAIVCYEAAVKEELNDPELLGLLAGVYRSAGRHNKAVEYHQLELATSKKLGEKSEQYAKALDNYGMTLTAIEKYQEALRLHKQSAIIRNIVFNEANFALTQSGNNHALVVAAQAYHFGNAYTGIEDQQRLAIEYHKFAMSLRESRLAKLDVQLVSSLHSLARACSSIDYQASFSYYDRAIELGSKVLAFEHPRMSMMHYELAQLKAEHNLHREAIEHYKPALSVALLYVPYRQSVLDRPGALDDTHVADESVLTPKITDILDALESSCQALGMLKHTIEHLMRLYTACKEQEQRKKQSASTTVLVRRGIIMLADAYKHLGMAYGQQADQLIRQASEALHKTAKFEEETQQANQLIIKAQEALYKAAQLEEYTQTTVQPYPSSVVAEAAFTAARTTSGKQPNG